MATAGGGGGSNDAAAAAIRLLTRAVETDQRKNKKQEAFALYKEAIDLLLTAAKDVKGGEAAARFRAKASEALARAEVLRTEIEADRVAVSNHQQVRTYVLLLYKSTYYVQKYFLSLST